MKLDNEQTGILQGESGAVKAQALRTLIEYGAAFEAKRLVPIQSCHLAGSFGIVRFNAYYNEYCGGDLFDGIRDGNSVEIDGSTGEIRVR